MTCESMPTRAAVLLVNYRTSDLTVAAVESLVGPDVRPSDVYVVDNASGAGEAARLAEALPDAHIIPSAVNVGYGAGMNRAAAAALADGHEALLVLNNDVVAPRASSRSCSTAGARASSARPSSASRRRVRTGRRAGGWTDVPVGRGT